MASSTDAVQRAVTSGSPEEVFELLLEHVAGPWNTRKAHRSGWRTLQRWLDETGQSLTSPLDAASYQTWLHREYRGVTASVNNRLSQARRLYVLLRDAEVVDHNPFEGCSGQHNPAEERRRAYSPQDILKLLEQSGPEDHALVLLGAHAGLSGPEVRALVWAHVADDLSSVQVHKPGQPAGRVVPCTPELQAALQALAEARGHTPLIGTRPQGHLITGSSGQGELDDTQLRARIYRICERSGVPYRAWQALRNHAALRFLSVYDRDQTRTLLGLGSYTALLPSLRVHSSGQNS